MTLVDSSVWIAHFSGRASPAVAWLRAAMRADEPIAVIDLIVTEVLQGFRNDRDFELARRALAGLERLPIDRATYIDAARLFRRLRAAGVTVRGTIDCVVAQTCIAARARLLADDRDFELISGRSRLVLVRA